MKNIQYLLSGLSLCLLAACHPETPVNAPDKGTIDPSVYVAIGSSMEAGYADNALYREAQLLCYPNLLAQQLKLVGGGEFHQPLVDASSAGIGAQQNARYVLAPVTDCAGVTSLAPVAVGSGDLSIFLSSVGPEGPFQNLAVPGLKSVTAVYPGYGNPSHGAGQYNPYYTRFTSNPEDNSVLQDAAMQRPGFFTLAIGKDDIYNYAYSGGTQDVITPVEGQPGYGFGGSIDAIIGTLTGGQSKGVIISIPQLNTQPYFTTIPYNGLSLDAANAAGLTAAYQPLGITFHEGQNPFIIEDASAPGGMRLARSTEMILLSIPQDSLKCGGWGSMKPIPNRYVLTETEISTIDNAVDAYNSKLRNAATAADLVYIDINEFFQRVKTGITYNGVNLNAQFVAGGIFSLDGTNLTPRGNALFTNEIIRGINRKYQSTIPLLDITRYSGIKFP